MTLIVFDVHLHLKCSCLRDSLNVYFKTAHKHMEFYYNSIAKEQPNLCNHAVRLSLCVYTDASPGVGPLVGGEITKSLGARLLVSVLCAVYL